MSRPQDESELVERARRGDERAYEKLVRQHQGIAFRTAYLIAGSATDAEEAAQDGFVKAYRALKRFRPGAPFRPWLLQIVANEARNRRRSAGRRAGLALRAAGENPSGGAAPSPEGIEAYDLATGCTYAGNNSIHTVVILRVRNDQYFFLIHLAGRMVVGVGRISVRYIIIEEFKSKDREQTVVTRFCFCRTLRFEKFGEEGLF